MTARAMQEPGSARRPELLTRVIAGVAMIFVLPLLTLKMRNQRPHLSSDDQARRTGLVAPACRRQLT